MAKIEQNQPLLISLIDRLIDTEPDKSVETPKARVQVLRELKQSVRRDLENLLNTRRRCVGWPLQLNELDQSLVNYGIPDFTGLHLGTSRLRDDFCRAIEQTIRRFEPRFKTVRVELLSNAEPEDQTLRFRIDALLYADPAPEPVIFDSALEPNTGIFEVRGAVR